MLQKCLQIREFLLDERAGAVYLDLSHGCGII
jgi:hypothetical protein